MTSELCYPLWDPFEGEVFRCEDPTTEKVRVISKEEFLVLEKRGEARRVKRNDEKSVGRNRG